MSAVELHPLVDDSRPELWIVPDLPDEMMADDVRSIETAPSLIELERAKQRHPAVRARQLAERTSQVRQPSKSVPTAGMGKAFVKVVGYLAALTIVVGIGSGVGLLLRPASYSGEVWEHSVSAGESLWGLAEGVQATKPIEDVMEDIRSLNSMDSDRLVVGQSILLPLY